jgi:DNA-binding transcriptional regulator YhcF (GntR family)
LQPGERLSTVRALARELTVAPNTVVKAYNELQRMGLIESKPGLGTVVVGNLGEAVREQRIEDRYKRLGTLVRDAVGLWIRRTSSRSALARSSNVSTGERRAGREHDIRANELRSVTRRSWRMPAGCASLSSDMATGAVYGLSVRGPRSFGLRFSRYEPFHWGEVCTGQGCYPLK